MLLSKCSRFLKVLFILFGFVGLFHGVQALDMPRDFQFNAPMGAPASQIMSPEVPRTQPLLLGPNSWAFLTGIHLVYEFMEVFVWNEPYQDLDRWISHRDQLFTRRVVCIAGILMTGCIFSIIPDHDPFTEFGWFLAGLAFPTLNRLYHSMNFCNDKKKTQSVSIDKTPEKTKKKKKKKKKVRQVEVVEQQSSSEELPVIEPLPQDLEESSPDLFTELPDGTVDAIGQQTQSIVDYMLREEIEGKNKDTLFPIETNVLEQESERKNKDTFPIETNTLETDITESLFPNESLDIYPASVALAQFPVNPSSDRGNIRTQKKTEENSYTLKKHRKKANAKPDVKPTSLPPAQLPEKWPELGWGDVTEILKNPNKNSFVKPFSLSPAQPQANPSKPSWRDVIETRKNEKINSDANPALMPKVQLLENSTKLGRDNVGTQMKTNERSNSGIRPRNQNVKSDTKSASVSKPLPKPKGNLTRLVPKPTLVPQIQPQEKPSFGEVIETQNKPIELKSKGKVLLSDPANRNKCQPVPEIKQVNPANTNFGNPYPAQWDGGLQMNNMPYPGVIFDQGWANHMALNPMPNNSSGQHDNVQLFSPPDKSTIRIFTNSEGNYSKFVAIPNDPSIEYFTIQSIGGDANLTIHHVNPPPKEEANKPVERRKLTRRLTN